MTMDLCSKEKMLKQENIKQIIEIPDIVWGSIHCVFHSKLNQTPDSFRSLIKSNILQICTPYLVFGSFVFHAKFPGWEIFDFTALEKHM